MIILQILFATYVIGVILVAAVLFMSVYKVGGFTEFSEMANTVGGDPSLFNSNKTQWLFAFIILAWPAVPFIVAHALRSGKTKKDASNP